MENTQENSYSIGTLYALAAFGLWGILPAYWKLLKEVPVGEILAHRIFWAFVFTNVLLYARGQWPHLKLSMSSKNNRIAIICSAILVSVNWSIFIWAINTDQIIEASIGYYINPLFNILLGLLVLRERMNFWQYVSVIFASIGVIILTVRFGRIPWIALTLTVTFGLYGLLKKTMNVDSLIGLGIETLLISPFCLAFIMLKYMQGTGSFGISPLLISVLLTLGGVVTALPLLWFAQAAKRIPLSRVGFLQYLAPTISLLLGVFIYHEPFTLTHMMSFGCIWAALALYSFSGTAFMKNIQPTRFSAKTDS